MARNRRNKTQVNAKNNTPSVENEEPISISLRIPGRAARSARLCANDIGISLNGLICIALADYLHSKGYSVHSV